MRSLKSRYPLKFRSITKTPFFIYGMVMAVTHPLPLLVGLIRVTLGHLVSYQTKHCHSSVFLIWQVVPKRDRPPPHSQRNLVYNV